MPVRRTALCCALPAAVATAAFAALPTTAAARITTPPAAHFEMPFQCHQEWTGSSRSNHSPSALSIDWNRTNDVGKRVVAAAPGVVTRVQNLGSRSYGRYLVVDHGNGESTLYAHLQAQFVTVGQHVDQGEAIGAVGGTGAVTGPHLHYEQRLDGRDQPAWFHAAPFQMGGTQRSANCVDTPVAGDWDGDKVATIGVYRRLHNGRVLTPEGTELRAGRGADEPVVGDWDGDGRTDAGVRRSATSTFVLRTAGGTRSTVAFGLPTDRAVAGDWDGDGTTDLGVWRPGTAEFVLRNDDGSTATVPLGTVAETPVTGDWDGDGITDVGTYLDGTWTLRSSATGEVSTRTLGASGDLPVTGDWNGNGSDDLGVWSPATATFTLRKAAPRSRRTGTLSTIQFGNPR